MFWGILMIAIGIGALLDIAIWPVVLIGIGAGLLLSRLSKSGRRNNRWFGACGSWPFESKRDRASFSDREHSHRTV